MQQTPELLRALVDARVEFVVIGGVAAIAHGAATFTRDFDVAAPFDAENMRRLMTAIGSLGPRHALSADKIEVREPPEELARFRNLYILTDLGRLDVLGEVPPIGSYADVARHAVTMDILGLACRVIHLDQLIEIKASMGRGKDRTVEMELRAIRDRIGR